MREPIKEIMKETLDMSKKKKWGRDLKRQSFQGMDLGKIQELIDTTPEELTEDDLVEMNISKPVPHDKDEYIKEAVTENQLIYNLAGGF